MVSKNVILIDLSTERLYLVASIRTKIAASKILPTNEYFDKIYKITAETDILLSTIEEKIRKAQIIYHTYLEDIDPQIINGSNSGMPFELDAVFTFGTTVFKNEFSINTPSFYKEMVDMNFQTFILTIASAYENIVRLNEQLVKKVIIHNINKPPLSSPLHNYLEFMESLLHLDYRSVDPFTTCLYTHRPYFDQYLITINNLRNSFIHGYINNTALISSDYKVTKFEQGKFNQASPKLNVDVFSEEVLRNTRNFITDLLITLTSEIVSNTVGIPI